MRNSRSDRRRTKIVNKSLQRRLMFDLSVVPALGLIGMMGLVSFFCHRWSVVCDSLQERSIRARATAASITGENATSVCFQRMLCP